MDETLTAIAADEGATWILAPEPQEGAALDVRLSIPEELRQMLSTRDVRPAVKRRVKLGKFTYDCRFFYLRRVDGAEGQPYIALHLNRDSSVSDAVDLLADDYNLTDREQEALKAIAIGLTSKEIAARMNISPNTVKSFIRIIMLKMGIDSRAAMMGKLLEYSRGKLGTMSKDESS
jgi:DNA-binding CsgD family transcriptional regulator